MSGRSDIPASTRYEVVEAMENGLSASEAGREYGVNAATAASYWRSVYGGIPWPSARKPKARLRFIRSHRGWVTLTDYECSHCGALVRHASIDAGRPNYCPWCGEALE